MKKHLFIIWLCAGISMGTAFGQEPCVVDILFAEAHECDSNQMYFIDIYFENENTSDSFSLLTNDMDWGNFSYDLEFVTVGPLPGDGISEIKIVLTDVDDPNCLDIEVLAPLDCSEEMNCKINTLFAEAFDCDSTGQYDIHLVVHAENASDSFMVLINGEEYGTHAYEDVPVQLGPFSGDGETDLVIVVMDQADSLCIADHLFEAINCHPDEDCALHELFVEAFECDSTGHYDIHLVVHAEHASDSFMVVINGEEYGTHAYEDIPVQLGPFPGDGETNLAIIVKDQVDSLCIADHLFEAINCHPDCSLHELFAESFECDSTGHYDIHLVVHAEHASDSFMVVINGEDYGTHAYEDVPVQLGPFPGDGETDLAIIVMDQSDSLCIIDHLFEARTCEPHVECALHHLIVEASDCDDHGRFNLELTFQSVGLPGGMYDVSINQSHYGTYHIDELPLRIEDIEPRDSRYQLIRICSSEDENCCIVKEFLIPCCHEDTTCEMANGRFTIWCSEDQTYYILLDFDISGTYSDSIRIDGNGREYGRFAYNDRPVILGPFERNDLPHPEFVIRDLGDRDCHVIIVPDGIECDNPTSLVYITPLDVSIWSSGNYIEIEGEQLQQVQMRLTGLDGKQLAGQSLHNGHNRIWVGHLNKGIYLVTLDTRGQSYSTKLLLGR